MTDAEKNPRRYVLLKKMRAVGKKRRKDGEGCREKERKKEREREGTKGRERMKKAVGSLAVHPRCVSYLAICISYARSFIKTSRTARAPRKLIPYKCCREYREDFTLPKIH